MLKIIKDIKIVYHNIGDKQNHNDGIYLDLNTSLAKLASNSFSSLLILILPVPSNGSAKSWNYWFRYIKTNLIYIHVQSSHSFCVTFLRGPLNNYKTKLNSKVIQSKIPFSDSNNIFGFKSNKRYIKLWRRMLSLHKSTSTFIVIVLEK